MKTKDQILYWFAERMVDSYLGGSNVFSLLNNISARSLACWMLNMSSKDFEVAVENKFEEVLKKHYKK